MRYRLSFVLLGVLSVIPGWGAAGQAIRGRVLNEITGRPVAGAIVDLVPGKSGTPHQLVTNGMGVFVWTSAQVGEYSWRIRAIGFAPTAPQHLTLNGGDVTLPDARIRPAPLPLLDVAARGAKACIGSSNPAVLSSILSSVQNTIEVMDATIRSGRFTFELRDTAVVTGRAVRPPPITELRYLQAWPVRAVDPEILRTIGFSVVDSSSQPTRRYYGPDPVVLFTDWFLADHCFALEFRKKGADSILIVRYDPLSTTRAEIAGELTIDRGSMAITRMTWEHRNLPKWIDPKLTGGEMVFDTIAGGVWYPASWTMRAPSEGVLRRGRLDNAGQASQLIGPVTGLLTRITRVKEVIRQ